MHRIIGENLQHKLVIAMPNIRLYQDSDYLEIIQLWLNAGLILSLSDNHEELRILASRNQDSFLILEHNSKIIGSVIGAFDGRRGYIHHLAVDPEFQGMGYGRLLMDEITQYFEEQGVVKIHLMIEKSNSKVKSFYDKLDWYVRDDLILMTKTLRTGEFTDFPNR